MSVSVVRPRRLPMEKTTYAVCRRVHGRRFLLRPDAMLTALVMWLLAVCASTVGAELHAVTVMSTHFHLVLSVDQQKVSRLMEILDGPLARAINRLRGIPGGIVWEPGQLSIVECKTEDAVVKAIAYAIVNPVAAGAVWRPEDWPGLCVLVEEIGQRVLQGARPGYFFRSKRWPLVARLATTWPPCLVALGVGEARERVRSMVEALLEEAHADIRAKRFSVRGALAAKAVSPLRQATREEHFGSLHPLFATGPGRVVERLEAIEELKAFQQAYRAAWQRYQAGEREVVFPYGTYLMRVRHGVRVAPPPT